MMTGMVVQTGQQLVVVLLLRLLVLDQCRQVDSLLFQQCWIATSGTSQNGCSLTKTGHQSLLDVVGWEAIGVHSSAAIAIHCEPIVQVTGTGIGEWRSRQRICIS